MAGTEINAKIAVANTLISLSSPLHYCSRTIHLNRFLIPVTTCVSFVELLFAFVFLVRRKGMLDNWNMACVLIHASVMDVASVSPSRPNTIQGGERTTMSLITPLFYKR